MEIYMNILKKEYCHNNNNNNNVGYPSGRLALPSSSNKCISCTLYFLSPVLSILRTSLYVTVGDVSSITPHRTYPVPNIIHPTSPRSSNSSPPLNASLHYIQHQSSTRSPHNMSCIFHFPFGYSLHKA